MTNFLETLHAVLWGAPALVLILGVGIYLTVCTRGAQIRLFPRAMKVFFGRLRCRKSSAGEISPFQALCTALAATVGTGNLVGVAGAICLGGPGAVFWMWVCGILGMATKFAEATLAVRFRIRENGEYKGGPMYVILKGMGSRWKWLASVYSFFGVAAAFGVGNATQINAVITGLNGVLKQLGSEPGRGSNILMGLVLAVLIGFMLLGGARRIGTVAERLVPFASAAYILLCLGALLCRADAIPGALRDIMQGAFQPRAVTGGVVGSAVRALSVGCSRGVFTNEAGMGTASIAHAGANVSHPVEQGIMGIVEVFLDTILICTLTALVILCSGVPVPYGLDAGGELTTAAFSSIFGSWVTVFLAGALCCFAFATVLGWGLYGARCAEFLLGSRAWKHFAVMQTVTVMVAAVLDTRVIWLLAETLNGLMAIPNLTALAFLSPELKRLTLEYKQKIRYPVPEEVQYADFHQCESLRAFTHAKISSLRGGGEKKGKAHLSSEHRSA